MGRLGVILSAIWNKILGRQEDKYYNEILDLSYEQMQAKVVKVGQGLASVAQSKHSILALVTENRKTADKYDNAAIEFLKAGDEEKATQALLEKAYVDQELVHLQEDLNDVTEQQSALTATKKDLDRMIRQFAAQKEALKGRHTAAKATAEIAETMTGISETSMDVGQTVGRMRERTAQMEARAAGVKELMASGALENMFTPGVTSLDRSVAAIGRETKVQEDLARLKKELFAKGELAEPAKTV